MATGQVELFSNLGETTLSSAYTAGDGKLQVVSASGFPTTGPFRVRLGNVSRTILRVDYIIGTTFYVTVEANDAAAAATNPVTIVITEATLERFMQIPIVGAGSDPIWAPGGSAGVGYGPIFRGLNVFDPSAWTWTNQGSAVFYVGGGVVLFHCPTATGTNLRLLTTSLPSRPFQVTIGLAIAYPTAGSVTNLQGFGLCLRESGTGKIQFFTAANFKFSAANGPMALWLGTYASATSATSVLNEKVAGTDFSAPNLTYFNQYIFLRLSDDGTNVTWEWSWDRVNWNLNTKQARGTGFTTAPDQYGVALTCQSSTPPLDVWVMSWELRQPGGGIVPGTGSIGVVGQQVTRSP